VYLLAEAIGGWLTGSLALLADAGHMLSDVAALGLSLFASWIGRRPTTPRHTFGYYRAEILAALANGAALVAISMLIVVEALSRLSKPPPIQGPAMLAIASGGLVVNLVSLRILHASSHDDLNLHGAWLHVLTDALGSVGAVTAGVCAWKLGWLVADPVASILIALLVVFSAWTLLRQAVDVLMEGTPRGIDVDDVRRTILSVAGVCEVHDLHVWTITSGMVALSAHVGVPESGSREGLLVEIREVLERRFGIDHATIQVETGGGADAEACAEPSRHP
jgi:cobalt-zinc-cadmium efflux system protein